MQLSQTQETLSQAFCAFLKSALSFQYFEKKDDPNGNCISEMTSSGNVVTEISKESRCRGSFCNQRGRPAEKLLKSASQHLYHIQ